MNVGCRNVGVPVGIATKCAKDKRLGRNVTDLSLRKHQEFTQFLDFFAIIRTYS